MPVTYHLADRPTLDLLATVIRRYHHDLGPTEAGVTFAVLMATHRDKDGDPTGKPAVKHGGTPAAAVIRVNRLADRMQGMADLTILVDAERWDGLTAGQREALLDHEVEHVVLQRDKRSGAVKRDDLGRPVVKLKPDEFALTAFGAVVERHGRDALEYQAVRAVAERFEQLLLGFEDGEGGGESVAESADAGEVDDTDAAATMADQDDAAWHSSRLPCR